MPYFSSSTTTLPEPSPEAQAHSHELKTAILTKIKEKGVISFQAYMQMALYQSGLGYYPAGCAKFGESGDFVTAPEISPLFGQCVANAMSDYLKSLPNASILEFGPGSGELCVQAMKQLESLSALPEKYFLLEISPSLKARQKALVEKEIPHLAERLEWLQSLPKKPFSGVVLANEVIDALAINRFKVVNQQAVEIGVTTIENEFAFVEYRQALNEATAEAQKLIDTYQLPNGYEFEMQPELACWLNTLYDRLEQGFALLIDYGENERELFRRNNHQGTLRCFYQHHLVEDPFRYPGLQDITSDVNFTAVAEAAVNAGFRVSGYTSQALFLLSTGLEHLVDVNSLPEKDLWKMSQAIQLLTSPNEMGERFKAIALAKNTEENLNGFSIKDLRGRL